jgi:hypothetical protein
MVSPIPVTAPGGKDKFSPYGELAQGEGKYTLKLSKTPKKKSTLGQVIYIVESHCESTSGNHTQQSEPEPDRKH